MAEREGDGNLPSELGERAKRSGGRSRRLGPGDGAWAVLLLLEVAASWAAWWAAMLGNFAYDACPDYPAGTCVYAVGAAAVTTVEYVSVGVLVLVVVTSVIRFLLQKSRWWVPLVGTGMIVLTATIAVVQTQASSH